MRGHGFVHNMTEKLLTRTLNLNTNKGNLHFKLIRLLLLLSEATRYLHDDHITSCIDTIIEP